jgi:hypothetical protein
VRLAKKGRRAEQRGAAMKGCLGALVLFVLNNLDSGWMLMLGVGVIHAEWIPQLPTLGFCLIAYLLRTALSHAPRVKSKT